MSNAHAAWSAAGFVLGWCVLAALIILATRAPRRQPFKDTMASLHEYAEPVEQVVLVVPGEGLKVATIANHSHTGPVDN